MNELFICSFRTNRKGKPIELECLDSIYTKPKYGTKERVLGVADG